MSAAPAQVVANQNPPPERYVAQAPTVRAIPVPAPYANPHCCGACPGWHKTHPQAPFGQCLPAIKWLGSPLYTPDLAGCTLDPMVKMRGASR